MFKTPNFQIFVVFKIVFLLFGIYLELVFFVIWYFPHTISSILVLDFPLKWFAVLLLLCP